MIQQTSLLAYESIVLELGQRQTMVYRQLMKCPATNLELSRITGLPINSITPRVHELRKRGLVKRSKIRNCGVSGRKAIEWSVM